MQVIGTTTTEKAGSGDKLLYIGAFLGSVILMSAFAGKKATYYYLLLVLFGVMIFNVGKYNIKVTTPEIMKG